MRNKSLAYFTLSLLLTLVLQLLPSCSKHELQSAATPSVTPAANCSDSFSGTRQTGVTTHSIFAYAAAVDSSCNYYTAGYTDANLDGNTRTGLIDLFVTKYDSAGTRQWTKLLGSPGQIIYIYAMAADGEGNTYLTGFTTGPVGDQVMVGNSDLLVVKYDKDGNLQWSRISGVTTNDTMGYGIAVDLEGNVAVTGQTWGNLDGNTLQGSTDGFVMKYRADGTKLWTKTIGVVGASANSVGIAASPSGAFYISGSIDGSLPPNTVTGTQDAFVAKYDTDGDLKWVKQHGVMGAATAGKGIAVDSNENIFISGTTTGSLASVFNGVQDLFVAKYDSTGDRKWTRQLGTAAGGVLMDSDATVVDSLGNVYVAGDIDAALDGNTLTGNLDVFVTKYDTSGTKEWTKQNGAVGGNSRIMALNLNAAGTLFMSGFTDGHFVGHTLTGDADGFTLPYNSTTGALK